MDTYEHAELVQAMVALFGEVMQPVWSHWHCTCVEVQRGTLIPGLRQGSISEASGSGRGRVFQYVFQPENPHLCAQGEPGPVDAHQWAAGDIWFEEANGSVRVSPVQTAGVPATTVRFELVGQHLKRQSLPWSWTGDVYQCAGRLLSFKPAAAHIVNRWLRPADYVAVQWSCGNVAGLDQQAQRDLADCGFKFSGSGEFQSASGSSDQTGTGGV